MMSDDAAERQVSDAELGRDAQRYITVDAEILSGTPCLKGTRVPAHYIADMVANGDSASAILAAYPYLTEGQIHAAVAYARAFPEYPLEHAADRRGERISLSYRATLR